MNTFWIIIAISLVIELGLLVIFLMGIWKAIIGKSTIDSKLAMTMMTTGKKMDGLSGSLDKNSNGSGEVAKQLKEVARNLKDFKTEK